MPLIALAILILFAGREVIIALLNVLYYCPDHFVIFIMHADEVFSTPYNTFGNTFDDTNHNDNINNI